jgi:hypothetical protein
MDGSIAPVTFCCRGFCGGAALHGDPAGQRDDEPGEAVPGAGLAQRALLNADARRRVGKNPAGSSAVRRRQPAPGTSLAASAMTAEAHSTAGRPQRHVPRYLAGTACFRARRLRHRADQPGCVAAGRPLRASPLPFGSGLEPGRSPGFAAEGRARDAAGAAWPGRDGSDAADADDRRLRGMRGPGLHGPSDVPGQ